MTMTPFIFASVVPIKVRIPLVRLKRPKIAMMGIVSPTTANKVRVGRVIKFCQANRHMKRSPSASIGPCRAPRRSLNDTQRDSVRNAEAMHTTQSPISSTVHL